MKLFPQSSPSNLRVFIACLLSFMTLMAPIVPVAASAKAPASLASTEADAKDTVTPEAALESYLFKPPVAAAAAPGDITATKADSFPDPNADGKAAPGEEITYAVDITNGGATDATGITFTDTIDANTTLVPGSVKISPLAFADNYTASENTTLNVAAPGVLANDTGTPAPTAQAIVGGATTKGGTVSLNTDGSFTYNPPAGAFTGADSFNYTITNGQSPDDTATVTISFNPTAVADNATVNEDAGATAIPVLANDTDPDAGPISITSTTQPTNGAVVITGGGTGLTYQPNANYCNNPPGGSPDTFNYTLSPGGSTATVTVTVTCVDDAPVAVADSATVNEDSGATAIDVLANDTDVDGGSKAIASATDPANGTVLLSGGSPGAFTTLTYQPDANYCNTQPGGTPDTFNYTLTPGSSSIAVSITVTCVDDNPTAVADAATVVEDSGASAIPVLTNDTDPDGGPKSITSVTQPTNGAVVITGGGTGLTYQPNANYCNNPPGGSPDTFNYTLSPGGSSTTVSVTVTCQDDAPVAVADTATVAEDSGAAAISVLANDTDVDGGPISITSVTQPTNGTVTITGGGTGLTYQPSANYYGPDVFTYTLSPGGSSTTVTVTVTEINDTPTTVADALSPILEDSGDRTISFSSLTSNDSAGPPNENTQMLNITAVSSPVGGTVQIVGTDVIFTPTANFFGTASFTYTVTDNGTTNGVADPKSTTGSVSFTITGVNDAPSFTKGADQTDTEDDGAQTVNGWATAISAGPGEGTQTVSFEITGNTNPALFAVGGAPAVSPTGTLTYTLAANQNGSTTITLKIKDNGGTANSGVDESATQSFTITVTAVNDAPVAQPKAFTVQSNMKVIGVTGFLSGVTDVDHGINGCVSNTFTLNSVSATSPAGGNVTITNASTGTIDFDPPPGASGTVTFTYTVIDTGCPAPGVVSAPATVTVTVNGPVIWFVDPNAATNGDGRLSNPFKFLANNPGTNNDADDVDAADHRIYLYDGSVNGDFTLTTNEWLVGQGLPNGTSFDSFMGITPPGNTIARPTIDGTKPVITTAAAGDFGVVLGSGNRLHGLAFSNTHNTAIFGSAPGTLAMSEIAITNTASTSGSGIVLSGSGTVTITGTNTIQTDAGTALQIVNTNIGPGNITFRSISAGNNTGSFDPANGILLSNTGTTSGTHGGLIITGDGGGSSNGSGGTIQRTTDVGISLTSTINTSLNYMNVTTVGNDGIRGSNVTNFTLNRSNLTNNGNATAENGLQFGEATGSTAGVFGTVSITNVAITGSAGNNVHVRNVAGTLSSFTVQNSSFNDLVDATGANSFLFEITDTATLTTGLIDACTFSNNTPQRALEVQTHNTGTITKFTVQNSSFTNNGIHASFTQDTTSNLTFNFLNNGTLAVPITGTVLQAINVFSSSTSTGGTIKGRIEGNFIGNSAVAGSGSTGGPGITVNIQGRTQGTLLINNNRIRQVGQTSGSPGMLLDFRGPVAAAQPITQSDLTLTNNDVQTNAPVATSPLEAILIRVDNQGSAARLRADIRGNTVPSTGTFGYPTFSGVDAQLSYIEAAPGAEGQLVDNGAASANADAELDEQTSGDAGDVYGDPGIVLIAGPITIPPAAMYKMENFWQRDYLVRETQPMQQPAAREQVASAHASSPSSENVITHHRSNTAPKPATKPAPQRAEQSAALRSNTSGTVKTAKSQIAKSQPAANARPKRNDSETFTSHASSKAKAQPMAKALSPVAAAIMPAGETVGPLNIGTLRAGKTVRITFKVTVEDPFTGPSQQVSNQGTVTGDGGVNTLTDDTTEPGANDPTVTPVLGPPDAVNDSYTAFKDTPLNIAAAGVLTNDTNSPTVTAVGSCADVTSPFNCTTAQSGTLVINSDGSFSYTPPSGYTGPDSFTYTATNAAGTDTATVNITVADTSAIYLNEVHFQPAGIGQTPKEYLEFRGVPNSVIPAGTYFVAIEGDAPGDYGMVQTIINLSGLQFGSNGFLVLLQQGHTYATDGNATVVTSTAPGFSGLPGGRWSAEGANTEIEDASVTFMLIQTGVAPTLTDDIDGNGDGVPDGTAYAGWSVRDSIGVINSAANGRSYGALNYVDSTGSGSATTGTTTSVGFTAGYVGRIGDSTGSTAADWVASIPAGTNPNFTLGSAAQTEPASFAGKPLNHIGASNFVNLPPVNSVPVATQNVNEDSTLTFNAGNSNLISISDPDAGTANVQVSLTATNGTITLSGISGLSFTVGDGTTDTTMTFTGTIANINTALNGLSYTPNSNYFGSATLTIVTNDQGNTGVGGAKTDTDVINISVGSLNDTPTANAQSVNTNEDTSLGITLTGSDVETPSGSLTFTIVSGPANGTLNPGVAGASQTYTPNANYNGPDSFTFKVNDGTADSAPATVSITVGPVNDTPTANAQSVNTNEETPLGITLTGTDVETASGSLTYTVTVQPTNGVLSGTAPNLTYTPNSNYTGPDSFKFTVTDTGDGVSPALTSAEATISITVNGINDAPSLDNTGNMSLSAINEDETNASNNGTLVSDIIASAGGDRITDIDSGALEGIAVTAVNSASGTWQFTVDNGTNWTPFGTPDTTTARLLAANANTRVRFIPNANFNGTINPGLTFHAWDQTSGANGGTADVTVNGGTTAFSTATETASITVNPVNDTPTANAQTVGTSEDTPVGITLTGSDVETASGSLSFTVTSLPANGTLTGTAPNLTYTPNPNYNGPDSFTFTVTDTGDGSSAALTSAPATITVNVGAVNDAPTADAQSVSTNEDTPKAITLTGNDIDTPAGSLTYIIVTGPTNGTLSAGTGPNRTYTPNANYNGPDSFTFKINDGTADSNTATVSITVNAVNDTPTANAQSVTTNEDTPKAITLTGSDTETASGSLTFTVTVQPTNGVLSGTGANLTYTPNANYNGPDSFKFTVTDTGDGSSPALTSPEATVSITVDAVNDGPSNTVPGAQNALKNGSLAFNAANSNLISIADVDAGTSPVQVTLTATNGRITLSGTTGLSFTVGDGTSDTTMTFTGTIANINNALNGLVFEPTNGYDGPASIQIVTNDQGNTGTGGALSDTDTINITVLKGGVLDFSSATYTVAEDGGSATITVNRTDGSNGTVHVDYTTSNGTATAGQDYTTSSGQLTFNNGVTTQSFTVPITNDSLDEANETINLTLSNATGSGALGTQTTAVLTITDNDPTPSLSINNVSLAEGNAGPTSFDFTVTLSAASGLPVTVNYQTADGTAAAPGDYQAVPSTLLTFNPGETTKTITITVNGEPTSENDETFFVNLSGATNASISDSQGLGTILSDDTPVIQLSSTNYNVNEDALYVTITVERIGDISQPATIRYTTNDQAGLTNCNVFNGIASPRCDYAFSVGKLRFAAGESSRDIIIPIVNDVYVEGAETFTLTLSNATGGELGSPTLATITINDNDSGVAPNPIDNNEFFLRALYIDFLGRLPDGPGLAAWLNILNNCPPADTTCDRVEVARGFAHSDEFANRGYFIYRFHRAGLGEIPQYSEFIPDMARLSGFQSAQDLEAAKVEFIEDFMARPEFQAKYGATDAAGFVNLLEQTALVTIPNKQALINDLANNTKTRAQVLRIVMELGEVYAKYYNEAFIVMNYFGFLRRDPDAAYQAWINIFNQTNDHRLIINGFMNSAEYRQRFGP